MTFDPMTFPLEADLSRADVCVLHDLCHAKSVVEFGCGGSTVLLAQFAASVVSYDTSPDWIARAQHRLVKEVSHTCRNIILCSSVPDELPTADVYFIDGDCQQRAQWVSFVIARRLSDTIIVHDSRSLVMNDIAACLVHPLTLSLLSLEYHVDDSNLLIIRTGPPVQREDWNLTEPANRLPHLLPAQGAE